MTRRERPINLDLTKFAFPITAIASILHRVTGVILFVGIAFMLYALDLALESEAGLEQARSLIATPIGMFVTWGLLTTLGYHFVAGIKHLIMDFGHGETLAGGRLLAQGTIVLAVVLSALAGVWVW